MKKVLRNKTIKKEIAPSFLFAITQLFLSLRFRMLSEEAISKQTIPPQNRRHKSLVVLLSCFLVLTACRQQKTSGDMTYTCPMHPDIIKEEPSTCPICGMDLVPVHHNTNIAVDKDITALTKPVSKVILSDVKTVYPEMLSLTDTILLNGNITYNNNNRKTISSYVSGRVEKLYIRYNYQPVKKGQKIMDIYSPDLVNAQQEVLFLKNNEDEQLLQKAKNKLKLLGATEAQISQLMSSGKISYRFGIYSNADGYIIDGNKTNGSSGNVPSTTTMSSMSNQPSTSTTLSAENEPVMLREGMYVNAGESIFSIYDASSLWAEFYIPAEKSSLIKKGNIILIDGKEYKIHNLQPYFKDEQNFSIIRIALNNKDYKTGQIAEARIIPDVVNGLWIPASAVYYTGNKNVVFALSAGKLITKTVTTGAIINNKILIKKGLSGNEKIAEQAAFLVDSEGLITTNHE